MELYRISSVRTRSLLFEGRYSSFGRCLEAALAKGIDLRNADLRRKNLSCANLDDACLEGADFRDANLTGVNLTEARLNRCDFSGALLFDACFGYSELRECLFRRTRFGGTDFAGADLSGSVFSGREALFVDFAGISSMEGVLYESEDGQTCGMSWPPMVLSGFSHPVAVLDGHFLIGRTMFKINGWPDVGNILLPLVSAYGRERSLKS